MSLFFVSSDYIATVETYTTAKAISNFLNSCLSSACTLEFKGKSLSEPQAAPALLVRMQSSADLLVKMLAEHPCPSLHFGDKPLHIRCDAARAACAKTSGVYVVYRIQNQIIIHLFEVQCIQLPKRKQQNQKRERERERERELSLIHI